MSRDVRVDVAGPVSAAVRELISVAAMRSGQLLVVGCSTSEIAGQRIGTGGGLEIAHAVLDGLLPEARAAGVDVALQCCEHLNRALVVKADVAERYGLEQVTVFPVPRAGGSLAAAGMRRLDRPVVVERVQAHAGIDIGHTLIGMHLRPVAVPVRLAVRQVGQAPVVAARTRPKLIGGARAVYVDPESPAALPPERGDGESADGAARA